MKQRATQRRVATPCYIFEVILKMKDKIARDKKVIADLRKDLDRQTALHFEKTHMCRKLIALAKKSGAEDHEVFEIIQNDHFLRKQI